MTFSIQDTRLNEIISRIPVFENVKSLTPLGGGLTNINYRVDTLTGTYVMRVSDSTSGLLGINRDNERVNTIKACEAGVGAAVVDSLIKENVLVISWIDAKTLHAGDIHQEPALLKRMAASLKKLHSGPAFQGEFYFPAIRKKYLQTVIENDYFLPDQYLELEQLILELERLLEKNPEPFVSCNNDLLAENFMDDGKKIWIIDYEYSGQNEASFDIGNLASELFLNGEETTILCDAYWQEHSPVKIARAMGWSMIARYGWTLWASIQEAVSPIHFDFRTWGAKKWNSVLPELQGEHYYKILELLKQK
jgi:thiamine kinase-like enzyme